MTDIKDILTQQEVTPSPDCWDKISGRLDVAMPQGAGSAATQAAAPSSQAGHFLGSLTAKIMAGVVGAAAVATVVTTVVLMNDKKSQPVETSPVIVADTITDGVNDEDTVLYPSVPVSPSTLAYPETPYSSSVKTSESADNPSVQDNIPTTESIPPTPSSPSPSSPLVPHVSHAPHAPHASLAPPSPSVATPEKSQSTATRPIAQSVKQDPVLQNLSEDAVDWTPPVKLEIPNVFTPNGDGYNDRFVIDGLENCIQRQLVVRNRAGQIVYRNNSYENTWDGGDCPDGVYNYQFTYKGDNGIEQTMSGIVYIIRR